MFFFFSLARSKEWDVLEVDLGDPPSSGSNTQEFSWKGSLCTRCTAVAGMYLRRERSELWAAVSGRETRGGLFSQGRFLAAWRAPAHTSLTFGSTKMLATPTRFSTQGRASWAHPLLGLRRWRDGADLVFKLIPIHCTELLPDFKCTQKPGQQLHQGTLSPEERYWSPLFLTTIRRSLHKDSLFLLLWLAPIWPVRSPYSEQWTSSSADKTNH